MTRCSILECKNNSSIKNLLRSGVSYHRFPKDAYIKEQWITATGRINWMPTKSSCICSEHFAENEILITKKGYRYIDHHVVPTKKIMSYQDEILTSASAKNSTLEEPGPSSEPPTKKASIQMIPLPKDCVIIKPADEITTMSHGASSANKSPSSSLYSTQRKKKLGGMLRWTITKKNLKIIRSTITKNNLKIKRLQAQNCRLKQRLENMEQLLKSLEEKFCISNVNLLV